MTTVTFVDVRNIQEYVLASNRLQDVVGSSRLVTDATDRLVRECFGEGNIRQAGGGRAVVVFDDEATAREATRRYTMRLADEAPGLDVAVVHEPLVSSTRDADVLTRGAARIEAAKAVSTSSGAVSFPGVARCSETSGPASATDVRGRPIARRVELGRTQQREVDSAMTLADGGAFVRPTQLEDLGSTRGTLSKVGVVYVDLNDVGKSIHKATDACSTDEERLRALDEMSERIKDTMSCAASAVESAITGSLVEEDADDGRRRWKVAGFPNRLAFPLSSRDAKTFIPLRAILNGGDDMLLVTDARLAVSVATTALRAVDDAPAADGWRPSASAGVVIAPTGFPFSRATRRAHELCDEAKGRRREARDAGADGSWLNWEVIGASSDRQLRGAPPLPLQVQRTSQLDWVTFERELLGEGDRSFNGHRWRRSRTKVKGLAAWLESEAALSPSGTDPSTELVRGLLREWNARGGDTLDLPERIIDGAYVGALIHAGRLLDLHLQLRDAAASETETA